MKGIVSDNYLEHELWLQECIIQFDAIGTVLYEGRNVVKTFEHDGSKITIKRFKVPNLINRIAYKFIRKSKAQRSFEYAHLLLKNGIGTPEPIAFYEEESTVNFGFSYYISEYLDASFTYRELIHDDSIENREQILRAYTQFIFEMHEAGIFFMDNSPGNTLIVMSPEGPKFYLVDLNRMKFYKIPFEDRLRNFERLSPEKWMYEIMGDEYAQLSGKISSETVERMWNYTQEFQEKFFRKKRLKNKFKSWIGIS